MSAVLREFNEYKKRLLEYRNNHEKPEQIEIDYRTHKFIYHPDGVRTFGCVVDSHGYFHSYIKEITMN